MSGGSRELHVLPSQTVSLLGPEDLHYFNEGTHRDLGRCLGAHLCTAPDGTRGVHFAVWAPNASGVELIGDFNGWSSSALYLHPQASSGIWAGFIPGLEHGELYKYRVHSHNAGYVVDKADPFAIFNEEPPRTASRVWDPSYEWGDAEWMRIRAERNRLGAPFAIYEVHLGSWMRGQDNRVLSYRELAPRLAEYVNRLGFTHVEFMPVAEHPFYGSWGYQVTGYFAPTARYGTPQDFKYLVDTLHQAGVGVILDWVPAHFPNDQHGLSYFDGSHLFEHEDPRQGFHPDWKSCIFNYSRSEVRAFLTSSALTWLKEYHADGLRVDGVASMLYLDYSREEGEWVANEYGGRENIAAISLLRHVNTAAYAAHPDTQMIAEESTAWGGVSKPPELGGLGFGMKWDMGWMHDTLSYMAREPVHRKYHHNELTFRAVYANHENFVLPLSHDEVVHGKGSIVNKMPGDDWQRLANLRLLYAYMWALPGKKLLFMGGEFAQWTEWKHDQALDWGLTAYDRHQGIQRLVSQLNALLRAEPALHEVDFGGAGFEWIELNDGANSVLSFVRKGTSEHGKVVVVLNFTPVVREEYRVGVDEPGEWREMLNTDAAEYGGSGVGNGGLAVTEEVPSHGRPHSLLLTVPPLGALYLKRA